MPGSDSLNDWRRDNHRDSTQRLHVWVWNCHRCVFPESDDWRGFARVPDIAGEANNSARDVELEPVAYAKGDSVGGHGEWQAIVVPVLVRGVGQFYVLGSARPSIDQYVNFAYRCQLSLYERTGLTSLAETREDATAPHTPPVRHAGSKRRSFASQGVL
jgi:hypothetical protein